MKICWTLSGFFALMIEQTKKWSEKIICRWNDAKNNEWLQPPDLCFQLLWSFCERTRRHKTPPETKHGRGNSWKLPSNCRQHQKTEINCPSGSVALPSKQPDWLRLCCAPTQIKCSKPVSPVTPLCVWESPSVGRHLARLCKHGGLTSELWRRESAGGSGRR